jgi:methylmalonyl-CoA mutase N-terminal domain/subunit
MGGMVTAIEKNYPQLEIADAAYQYQKQIDEKEKTVIGVNKYVTGEELPVEILQIEEELERNQIEWTNGVKSSRDNRKVKAALQRLGEAAQGNDNLMYPIVDAVKAYATEQEICDVFRTVFGVYRDPGVY